MTEHRYFCSTSNLAFDTEAELKAHYKSDFHRYNLKRKVAQLQPVTREWFEARRSKLAAADKQDEGEKVWICPLTKKKFASEKTYLAHTQTKKYKDALKKSGRPAPEPTVIDKPKPKEPTEEDMQLVAAGGKGKGVRMEEPDDVEDDDSGWETASDEGEGDAAMAEGDSADWDVRRCLFSNHQSATLEENLEYMFRNYGFIVPDMEYCCDIEGLLKYLGAKVGQAHIPLMESALVEEGKIFRSMHAVQRHMIDKSQCRVLYDGNEEEYEEYYDYSRAASTSAAGAEGGGELMAIDQEAPRLEMGMGGELVVGGEPGKGGGKVLGTRELARYYRQKYRPPETRDSVLINSAVARYRNLGIATARKAELVKLTVAKKSAEGQFQKKRGRDLRDQVNNVVNYNLPRNVPY